MNVPEAGQSMQERHLDTKASKSISTVPHSEGISIREEIVHHSTEGLVNHRLDRHMCHAL
jgi:hypothetical protein